MFHIKDIPLEQKIPKIVLEILSYVQTSFEKGISRGTDFAKFRTESRKLEFPVSNTHTQKKKEIATTITPYAAGVMC